MWCFSSEFDQVNSLPVDCTGCGWAARHRYPGRVEGVWGRHTHPVHFSPCHTRTFDQPVWEQLPKTEKKQLHETVEWLGTWRRIKMLPWWCRSHQVNTDSTTTNLGSQRSLWEQGPPFCLHVYLLSYASRTVSTAWAWEKKTSYDPIFVQCLRHNTNHNTDSDELFRMPNSFTRIVA